MRAAHACRILMVMLVALMSAASTVEATESPSDIPAKAASNALSAPANAGEYRMTPGDHVAIVVFNEPQLSGDFIVDDAGKLLMPLLGAVPIGGLTQGEAQKLIQDRLADGILVQPTVSLRIKEYRPVSIFGNVKKPGSYPFQFGQTVRAVIASAGGEGRLSRAAGRRHVRIYSGRRARSFARDAPARPARAQIAPRGPAERVPRNSWCLSSSASTPRAPRSACIIPPRTRSSPARWRPTANSSTLLQRQQPRLEAEMTALTKQLASEQRRTNFIKSRVAELDEYKNKGLVRTYVLNEQQREEARAGSEVARLEADIASLERQMGDLDIRIEEAKATFKRQVMNGLQETLQNLREIEVTLQTSRELARLSGRGRRHTG